MNKTHERLLMATLAGLVIAAAAVFAVSPAVAAGYHVRADAYVAVEDWDVLNVRKWPASYSKKIGELEPHAEVWVERCVINEYGGSDWCLIDDGYGQYGWVNSHYLALDGDYAEIDDEDDDY